MSSESFCPFCGGTIEAEAAVFCPHCGASLEEVSPEGVPTKPTEYRAVPARAPLPPGVQLASIGSRFVALLLDWIITGIIVLFIISAAIGLEEEFESGLGFLILLPIFTLFYWLFLEGINDGQTIGKMAVSIRVVKFDEFTGEISRCTISASVVRNLLRLIDGIFLYIVGLIAIYYSDYEQRIGDRVADTIVINA